ncbi:MAG: nitroreductase family protein [Candidatus Falkowbacteria bacterium]
MENNITKDFYQGVKARRSSYALSKEIKISDEKIQELVEESLKHAPSAFNSQSARAVILLAEQHNKLWDITKESLRKVVSEEHFPATAEKIDSFKNAYGTVLFFEDSEVIESLQKDFASYKDNFPIWSQQSSGMLQYLVWTSFAVEGLGASLQHYNGLIESEIKSLWQIPNNWQLVSQMPFGHPFAEPNAKEFMPTEQRMRVIK